MKKLPIKAAEDVGRKYGLSRVLLIAVDEADNLTHTVSWGDTKIDSGLAAMDIQKIRAVLEAQPTSLEDAIAAAERVRPSDIEGLIFDIYTDNAIRVLNEALENDSEAINELFNHRVLCNNDLTNHKTIQVLADDEKYSLGVLGLINGIVGIRENSLGYIASVHDVLCSKHGVADGKSGDECGVDGCTNKLECGKILRFERTDLK